MFDFCQEAGHAGGTRNAVFDCDSRSKVPSGVGSRTGNAFPVRHPFSPRPQTGDYRWGTYGLPRDRRLRLACRQCSAFQCEQLAGGHVAHQRIDGIDAGRKSLREIAGSDAPEHDFVDDGFHLLTQPVGHLPTWAGSPLAGRVPHPPDDKRSFMKSSHTPFPFDQPVLGASEIPLTRIANARDLRRRFDARSARIDDVLVRRSTSTIPIPN